MTQAVRIQPGQHIHLVGIGGVGLSAIARVLIGRGFRVSGSDRAASAYTDALSAEGVHVTIGHDAANISGADLIIVTSAANAENPEIAAARAAGIPVYKRSEIITDVINAGLESPPFVIAVAGTHGKTTTTSMITHMLITCGLNPGYIIGGTLATTGINGAAGGGDVFVIEADEYDNMFHGIAYDLALITSLEWDHPDFFPTFEAMIESFRVFTMNAVNKDGCVIACGEDAGIGRLNAVIDADRVRWLSYGRGNALHVRDHDGMTTFMLADTTYEVRITRPGMHNVLNALGALQAVFMLPLFGDFSTRFTLENAVKALATYQGTGRRFEVMGEVDQIVVIDDYAHHPTAIRVTLEAARMRYPERTLWAVWQPHTFSRTRTLWNDYLASFGAADHVIVTDIYAAREAPDPAVTADRFAAELGTRHISGLEAAAAVLADEVKSPAVILIMSAGDAPKIGQGFLARRGNS